MMDNMSEYGLISMDHSESALRNVSKQLDDKVKYINMTSIMKISASARFVAEFTKSDNLMYSRKGK